MPTFSCLKCGKNFSHKGTYDRHQNRKYSCLAVVDYQKDGIVGGHDNQCAKKGHFQNIGNKVCGVNSMDDLCKGSLPKDLVMTKIDFNKGGNLCSSSSSKKIQDSNYHNTISKNKNEIEILNNTISCNHCGLSYKSRSSLNRHLRNCKYRPISKADIEHLDQKLSKNVVTVLPKKNSILAQNITHNTTNNNTINNINNSKIIYVDNRNNNDKLLPFGKEDLEHLTNDLMKNIISQPEQGIIKLIQQVHFNEEKPQNQNIQMVNKKEPFLEVFNGKQWEKQDKKIAIQNMITTKKDIMDDYFDEQVEKNIISKFIKKNYETFSDMLDDYVRESLIEYDDNIKTSVVRKCLRLYREICKQAEILLINNKKKPVKQIEKNEGKFIEPIYDSEEEA